MSSKLEAPSGHLRPVASNGEAPETPQPMPQPRSSFCTTFLLAAFALVSTLLPSALRAQDQPQTPQALVAAMLQHENQPHTDRYEYIAQERSDRTGGHLWTERVVELPAGRVRLLLAEDGKPVSADRLQQERDHLNAITADPAAWERSESTNKNDEEHARQMLNLLPRAFLLDNVRLESGQWHMDFHPNPEFSPTGVEERVLHGMSGTLVIDAKDLRLVHIEGHLPQDVSIGFGLLATIHAGSRFESTREKIEGHWRTVHVLTDIRGKAALFKTVAKNSDVTRSDFHYLPGNTSPVEAVALVEKSNS